MVETIPFKDGPFLQTAALCEKVLEEKDGVKSAIRMIDRVTRTLVSPTAVKEMEPFDHKFYLIIRFKKGRAQGNMKIRIDMVKPSGEKLSLPAADIYFEGEEDHGVDVVADMTLKVEQTGIYWYRLFLDDIFITQMPLRIVYMNQVIGLPGTA